MIMKLVLPLFMILIAFHGFANAQGSQLNLKIENIPSDKNNRFFTFNRNNADVFFHTNDWNNKVFGITTEKDEYLTVRVWKNCDGGQRACGRVEPLNKSTDKDWPKPMNVTHPGDQLFIKHLFTEINKLKEEKYNYMKNAKAQNDNLRDEIRLLEDDLNNEQDQFANNLQKCNDAKDDLNTEYIRVTEKLEIKNDELQKFVNLAVEWRNEQDKLEQKILDLEENLQEMQIENNFLLEEKNSFTRELEKNEDLMRRFGNLVEKNKSDLTNLDDELKSTQTLQETLRNTDFSDLLAPELTRSQSYKKV